MSYGFWTQLPRPFFALAPISGVTDAPYRRIIAKYGKPDVMYTGFLPADGLCSQGREALLPELAKLEIEHPIVAQIHGCQPEQIREATRVIAELGFDGVDINMGCPVREIEKRNAGAALMRTPKLAQELILAAKEGAGAMPVSVKTRIGYHGNEIEAWLSKLLEVQPAAIAIHGRTRDEAYNVPARWDVLAHAVELARSTHTDVAARPLIIGNGDVNTIGAGQLRANESGCDGVMIGRRVTGNPWIFNEHVRKGDLSAREVFDVMLEHVAAFIEIYGDTKPLELMRKHMKAYTFGVEGTAQLRPQLMQAKSYAELREITARFCTAASPPG